MPSPNNVLQQFQSELGKGFKNLVNILINISGSNYANEMWLVW